MKLIIDIPDNEADFGMKVLKSLSFVRKINLMSDSGIQLLEDLKKAAEEVKLHQAGKIKLKTASDLLNEL